MADDLAKGTVSERLAKLLEFVAADPNNVALLTDAAETALSENRPDLASQILKRHLKIAPPSATLANLAGIAAMREFDFARAAEVFERLLETSPSEPSIRFNLAWSWAMLKNMSGALALLDEKTTEALPQAAMLHVQLLHDQQQFEEAFEWAKRYLIHHPQYPGLLAAISVLALDMDDVSLAKDCATRAGEHPDALITLGTLAIGDRNDKALGLFEKALKQNPAAARAWIGKGLVELAQGANGAAARDLLHGAELFGEHVGSWIASGWAHLLASNLPASRTSFDTALALDRNFSESHGSLAVINILEGKLEEARKQTATALRLDQKSFSGALAQTLLLTSDGKHAAAHTLVERALHTPIDSSGQTIAMAMARHGRSA